MQFCLKHLSWRFSMGDSGFEFFDVAGHGVSLRCYQPNGWVIGALGFLVVVKLMETLIHLFFQEVS